MHENAELWSRPDEDSIRTTLINYFERHSIDYEEDFTIEELRQLYINIECGIEE